MALRTREELKQWLRKNREIKLKQIAKQKDNIKKIKAIEKERKRKHQQWLNKLNKEEEKKYISVQKTTFTFDIYSTKYVERFPSDDDIYNTREELKKAEENNEGRINWNVFNQLVEKTKIEINKNLNKKRY